MICISFTTLILLSSWLGCLQVVACVLLTLVNVAGFMHFWGKFGIFWKNILIIKVIWFIFLGKNENTFWDFLVFNLLREKIVLVIEENFWNSCWECTKCLRSLHWNNLFKPTGKVRIFFPPLLCRSRTRKHFYFLLLRLYEIFLECSVIHLFDWFIIALYLKFEYFEKGNLKKIFHLKFDVTQ